MNAESDRTGYYLTLSKLTGHSVRYLRVRACVRAALCTLAIVLPLSHALPLK